MKGQPIAICVTGGIGTGKSRVCEYLARLGATVVYADEVARELINSHLGIKKQIQRVFGSDIYGPDGTLDRKRMAKLIFQDDQLNDNLRAIVHPYAILEIERQIIEFKKAKLKGLFVVEAALVFEAGIQDIFEYIIVVDATEEQRISRIMRRDQLTRTEVIQRFRAQMSVREKRSRSDFIVYNTKGPEQLKDQCVFLFSLLNKISELR